MQGVIDWRIFSPSARIPTQIDGIRFVFQSDEFVTISPGQTKSVSTGVGFQMPNNVGGLVYPYGGFLSVYFPRFIYSTGDTPLSIKLWNSGDQPVHIQRGTKICKMLCQAVPDVQNIISFHKLNNDAIEPIKEEGSPGWILKSPRDCTIGQNCTEFFLTGIGVSELQDYNAFVYPFHEFATTSCNVSNVPNENLRIMVDNCSDEPIHISRGDDLGLIALSQPILFDVNNVVQEVQQLPHRPYSTISPRRG